ncbi:hypothetical protein [Streptomyces eurythermus]|uniref:hypothetical protein n=1 Tax=Streptomyces eurythermus TaxID=42237 RepID=UPI0033D61314
MKLTTRLSGPVSSHTVGRGYKTTYAYTANRLTSATDPTGGRTVYTYIARTTPPDS